MYNTRTTLQSYIRWRGEEQPITPESVRDWLLYCWKEKELASNTVIKYHVRMVSFFGWCVNNRHVEGDINPMRSMQRIPGLFEQPSVKTTITQHEYFCLQTAARLYQRYSHWYYIITIGWNTGLRMGDTLMLRWSDIDFLNQVITLVPSKTRKHGRRVEIPMSKELISVLSEYKLKGIPNNELYLFPQEIGVYRSMQRHEVRTFSKIVKAAKVRPEISFHLFRHTFITRLLDAGITAEIIATMTGQDLLTVMKYQHVSLNTKRQALTMALNHNPQPLQLSQAI